MELSLQLLFDTISQAKDETELRSHIIPKIGEHFSAQRKGIFFFDNLPLTNPTAKKAIAAGLSTERNPVARYLVERHAPVHEALVVTPKVWSAICPRADHWHVMAGPVVSGAQLVGAVGCTRDRSMPAFDESDLADMSALCLHLSIWSTTIRQQQQAVDERNRKASKLTPRELQIAELVALGRTNSMIGDELWITENSVKQALKRMFRKLGVSSRTEMVTQLLTTK